MGGTAFVGRGRPWDERVKLSEEQRLDWLRLIRSDNVGPRTFRDLVNYLRRRARGARRAARRLPAAAALPDRRASARAEDAARRIESGTRARHRLRRARRARLSAAPADDRRSAAASGRARQARHPGAAAGRHCRLAQRLRRRRQIRRAPGARSGRGRLRHRLGAGARHRRRRAPRKPGDRHHRRARRRSRPHLSGRAHRLLEAMLAEGAAVSEMPLDLGAARARLPAPQPADLRALGRRRDRGGGAPLRLADHGAACRRAGPRGIRRARLAARSARGRHQRRCSSRAPCWSPKPPT